MFSSNEISTECTFVTWANIKYYSFFKKQKIKQKIHVSLFPIGCQKTHKATCIITLQFTAVWCRSVLATMGIILVSDNNLLHCCLLFMEQNMIHLFWFYFVITMDKLFYSLAEMSVNYKHWLFKVVIIFIFSLCNFMHVTT